jgi:hypothetical protein
MPGRVRGIGFAWLSLCLADRPSDPDPRGSGSGLAPHGASLEIPPCLGSARLVPACIGWPGSAWPVWALGGSAPQLGPPRFARQPRLSRREPRESRSVSPANCSRLPNLTSDHDTCGAYIRSRSRRGHPSVPPWLGSRPCVCYPRDSPSAWLGLALWKCALRSRLPRSTTPRLALAGAGPANSTFLARLGLAGMACRVAALGESALRFRPQGYAAPVSPAPASRATLGLIRQALACLGWLSSDLPSARDLRCQHLDYRSSLLGIP